MEAHAANSLDSFLELTPQFSKRYAHQSDSLALFMIVFSHFLATSTVGKRIWRDLLYKENPTDNGEEDALQNDGWT